MDPGDQILSLDTFTTWKVEALKEFLSKRGLSTSGTKAELVALCFSANTLKLPIKVTDAEYHSSLRIQYEHLLLYNNATQTDPLQLSGGWKDEKCGIHLWPPVSITDIVSFLIDKGNNENVKKHLNEYKVGKAYEYLQSSFIKEIFYHPISKTSDVCFMRAKCTPSQRLRDAQHTLWIMIMKENGEIVSAFCSCTAGLGQTCNHVAAMLFRIEAANRMGLSSCTSIPCQWVIPSETKAQPPAKIRDLSLKKSRFGVEKTRPLVSVQKKQYTPQAYLTIDRQELLDGLRKSLPNACVFKGTEVHEQRAMDVSEKNATEQLSRQIPKDVETPGNIGLPCLLLGDVAQSSTSVQDFLERQPTVTSDHIDVIQQRTIDQSNSLEWHRLRRGRITASNFYCVYTRMNTYEQNPDSNTDMTNVINLVMGDASPNPNIKSLRYGRDSEPLAKSLYTQMYEKQHQAVSTKECGLFLDHKYSFLAASPDMLVNCKCCGSGLLEVKAALIPKCDVCEGFCTCKIPDYLKYENHVFVLKKNHRYYCQIQGQMAITNRKWCDLCVYTCNGIHVQRIMYDEEYFVNVASKLVQFFRDFIAVEYMRRKLITTDDIIDSGDTYFCTVCKCQILEQENISSFSKRSICCDKCNKWFHFKCVGITKSVLNDMSKWFCKECNA